MFLKTKFIILMASLFLISPFYANDAIPQTELDDEILVAMFDWHHVVVRPAVLKGVRCGGNILFRNSRDVSNLVSSGIGILGQSLSGKKLSIESILKDFPSLASYENAMLECEDQCEEAIEETINVIKRLKNLGVILVLTSNMHENQYEHYKKSGKARLLELFDIHHIASKENGEKPHKEYYDAVLSKIHKTLCDGKEECVKKIRTVFLNLIIKKYLNSFLSKKLLPPINGMCRSMKP